MKYHEMGYDSRTEQNTQYFTARWRRCRASLLRRLEGKDGLEERKGIELPEVSESKETHGKSIALWYLAT